MKKYFLNLENKYKLLEESFLIKFYKLYPNLIFNYSKIFKYKIFRIIIYPIFLLSNIYGVLCLKYLFSRYPKACYGSDKYIFLIRDTNSQFHSIYFNKFRNNYEPDVTAAIQIFLESDSVFIDIGSNWGHHSIYAALEKGVEVNAFEPNENVFNCALSSISGKTLLSQDYFDSGIASINQNYLNGVRKSSKTLNVLKKLFKIRTLTETIEVKTLDSFNFCKVDLLKIDAEGEEIEILKGSNNTINRCRPVIIFEYYHNKDNQINNFLKYFESNLYELYIINIKTMTNSISECNFQKLHENSLNSIFHINLIAIPVEKVNMYV